MLELKQCMNYLSGFFKDAAGFVYVLTCMISISYAQFSAIQNCRKAVNDDKYIVKSFYLFLVGQILTSMCATMGSITTGSFASEEFFTRYLNIRYIYVLTIFASLLLETIKIVLIKKGQNNKTTALSFIKCTIRSLMMTAFFLFFPPMANEILMIISKVLNHISQKYSFILAFFIMNAVLLGAVFYLPDRMPTMENIAEEKSS